MKGSGKRTIAERIVELAEHDCEFVTSMKVDDIRAINEASLTLSHPKTYIFSNAQDMNTQAQNASLKTLEEASTNAYYIWTVNSELNILPTIRSRARIIRMDSYSRDELSEFTESPELLDMCRTPGQIVRYLEIDWLELLEHCEKVVNNIGKLNMANVFNILKSVKEDQYDLFIPMLRYVYWTRLNADFAIQTLKIIQDTANMLDHHTTVNKRNALETMLIRLWEVS
jgi:DNA polymerase III delta prime subunit